MTLKKTITPASKSSPSVTLHPQELEAVYAISRAVAQAMDTDFALDEIIKLVRPIFIFDNIVLYEQRQGAQLEPTYARAIGRGRSKEADLAWGEPLAQTVYREKSTKMVVEEVSGAKNDRTNIRHLLGLPLVLGDQIKGALVFIRFGGPNYTPEQISLAEFISVQLAQLLEYSQLVNRIANLEAKRRLDNLQDEFIAMITHELLTPLGFIKGYATTLLREDANWDVETRREFLTIIDEESDRLQELIGNMLDSSRLKAGTLEMKFQDTKLDTLLRDIILRTTTFHEDLEITFNIENSGVQVKADPTRLVQVFENIILNAVKYAPDSPIQISLTSSQDKVWIAIQDQGPGIPKEHLDKIFQRFYRVPNQNTAARGSGLGLFISKKIIESHQGKIYAESHSGEGTTFRICLPLELEL
jgi:signal transduction histidine kinase